DSPREPDWAAAGRGAHARGGYRHGGAAEAVGRHRAVGITVFRKRPGSARQTYWRPARRALLYLVIEELLVEAHEVEETPLATAMFFLEFGALFVLDMLM
ncbi:MAG: hypothetical protein ABJC36_12110, partial [Gemmatimonadales bacterium]